MEKKTLFKIGDIVIWSTVIGNKECEVLDVLDDACIGHLLVKEINEERTFLVIQPDAKLKSRPLSVPVKTYSKKISTAKKLPEYDNTGID